VGEGTISRMNHEGTDQEVLVDNLNGPGKLTFDCSTQKIYGRLGAIL
jgi:hypothetical protein